MHTHSRPCSTKKHSCKLWKQQDSRRRGCGGTKENKAFYLSGTHKRSRQRGGGVTESYFRKAFCQNCTRADGWSHASSHRPSSKKHNADTVERSIPKAQQAAIDTKQEQDDGAARRCCNHNKQERMMDPQQQDESARRLLFLEENGHLPGGLIVLCLLGFCLIVLTCVFSFCGGNRQRSSAQANARNDESQVVVDGMTLKDRKVFVAQALQTVVGPFGFVLLCFCCL